MFPGPVAAADSAQADRGTRAIISPNHGSPGLPDWEREADLSVSEDAERLRLLTKASGSEAKGALPDRGFQDALEVPRVRPHGSERVQPLCLREGRAVYEHPDQEESGMPPALKTRGGWCLRLSRGVRGAIETVGGVAGVPGSLTRRQRRRVGWIAWCSALENSARGTPVNCLLCSGWVFPAASVGPWRNWCRWCVLRSLGCRRRRRRRRRREHLVFRVGKLARGTSVDPGVPPFG